MLYPLRQWRIKSREKIIYLTFDDGPNESVTPWVLEQLNKYDAKATFFCVGSNMMKEPEIVQRIEGEGHTIGNHTFSHKNGRKCTLDEYIADVTKFNDLHPSKIFRPPYGRLPSSHGNALRKLGYRVVMWDVLSYDFDKNLPINTALEKLFKNITTGSIVVFHDSVKAEQNLLVLLPAVLAHFSAQGYRFESIPC